MKQSTESRVPHMILIIWAVFMVSCPIDLFAKTIGRSFGIASSPNPVGSGARALGMGGAFIAVADDATAASWNPAGLIQLETPEVSIVGAYDKRSKKYSSDTHPESNTSSHQDGLSLNYFSAAMPLFIFNKNAVVSVNYQRLYDFNRSLGYQIQFSHQGSAGMLNYTRHLSYSQNGDLGAIGLACAIQITPQMSLGVTGNIWMGINNKWEQNYIHQSVATFGLDHDLVVLQIKEEYSNMKGVNFNIGLLWGINSSLTLGLVFKTPFTAKFDHSYQEAAWRQEGLDGTVVYIPEENASDTVKLDMPMSYGLGLSWRFSDRFSMAADIYRTHWNDYILEDGQGNRMSPISALPESQSDVKNTIQFRLGGEYLFYSAESPMVIPVRAGFFYDPEPGQKSVNNFYGISIGSGIGYKQYIFDIAYQFRWARDEDSSHVIQESTADVYQHTVLFSFIYHF